MSANTAWVQEYRPKQLGELLGNQYVKEKLQRMLQADKLPQALMFTGIQGTGKTSLARIIASTLVCENPTMGDRCMECSTCEQISVNFIEKGRTVQGVPIFEYNIAKFNKREDVERIVERMSQRLLGNRKVIYILDEIQRATPEAQSCLLKVIEEPQPNVYVILCTTDKDKLTAPLRSRFHEVQIQRPTVEELTDHLILIARDKGLRYQVSALNILAEKYNCVPREAINKLEFIGLSHEVTQQVVYKELQMPTNDDYYKFFNACFSGNFMAIVQVINRLKSEERHDTTEFILGLERFLLKMLNVRASVGLEHMAPGDLKMMRKWAKRFHISEFAAILNEVTKVKASLSYASVDFILMQLALTISECLTKGEIQTVPDEELRQQYSQVTEEVVQTHIQREVTPLESVTPTQFMDIFGTVTQVETED